VRDVPRLCVGVLGGMGPEATVDFFAKLVAATPATRDGEHLRIVIDDDPSVPDRSAGVAGTGPSPAPHLARMARGLVAMGAEVLVMPCNGAHAFEDAVRAAAPGVPFLSLVEATVAATLARLPDATRVGLLATDGTLAAGIYHRAFHGAGVQLSVPDDDGQRRVMAAIRAVKGGDTGPATSEALRDTAERLARAGAQAVIAACTEIPLVLRDGDVLDRGRSVPVISSTDALVARTVDVAFHGAPVARGDAMRPNG
jgi:aspartate racemase